MLPALTAVLAGAMVAGAATLAAGSADSATQRTPLSIALTDSQFPDAQGGANTSGEPSGTTPTEDPAPPPTTTTTTEAPTSEETEAPAPPPATTAEDEDPPADPPPAAPDASQADQVVTLANTFRQDAGCGPLTPQPALTAAAQSHASDMASRSYFSHDTPEGVTFDQRIRGAGYSRPGAENIARGARTAESVMQMWMDSPGHRRNILNCDLSTIGIGLDRNGFYWVQDFGY